MVDFKGKDKFSPITPLTNIPDSTEFFRFDLEAEIRKIAPELVNNKVRKQEEAVKLRKQIRKLLQEMTDYAPKAGLIGGEWDRILEAVDFCIMLETMLMVYPYTPEELERFLTQVTTHHKFIMDTVHRKRRPHPERSKRKFM